MADKPVTRQEARAMSEAHAEGLHNETPRQFCPDCEGRDLSSYPSAKPVRITDPWKKITHRLEAAHARLAEALVLIEEQPNTGHISGNLEPVVEQVQRFHDLAAMKINPNKED